MQIIVMVAGIVAVVVTQEVEVVFVAGGVSVSVGAVYLVAVW